MISDAPYRDSTQYRLFSFASPESLLSQRTKANAHSRSLVPAETPYLTVQEEVELVDYYVDKLWGIVNIFKLPSHVKATATSFLLRYYLNETPLTTHPKHMILTALFLAAKTENSFIPIQYFKSQLPFSVDTSQLTSLEFPLSSGIRFSYTVWSCLRPLWGFGLDIMDLLNEGALNFEKDTVLGILDDARQWGMKSLRTDAQFLFTPPQIALSCIFHYSPGLVEEFLAIKFPRGRVLSPIAGEEVAGQGRLKQEDASEVLLRTVKECDNLISERIKIIEGRTKEETVNLVKGIDKKLYQSKKALDAAGGGEESDTAKRKTASPPEDRETKRAKVE